MRATVKGDRALIEKLQRLKKATAKKAIRKGSRAGCKLVQAAAKAMAPRRTGALAQALKVRALPRSRKWTGTQVTAPVATGIHYTGFVTLGTRFIRQPNDFIRQAMARVKAAAGDAFIEGIKQVVESEVKG